MKKLGMLGIAFLLMFSLASCGKPKTAKSASEFQTEMENAGYEVLDAYDQFPEDSVESMLIAMDEEAGYQIEFYVVATDEQAIGAFTQNKSTFESKKGITSSQSSVSLSNYSKYALSSDGQYYVISRIGNTFIFVETVADNKEAVDDMLKVLGY